MSYRKNGMATPCRGRLDTLDVRWDSGRLSAEFRVIGEDGRNLSALSCAKFLPRELFESGRPSKNPID